MTTFTGSAVNSTYKQLLQIGSGNIGLSGSIQYVQDGNGTASILGLSTGGVTVNGTFTIGSTTLTLGSNTTITTAASTVLDDTTVAAMVDTLGGASSSGTGGIARVISPTFTTPLLGTPTSGTLTNCTGLPVAGLSNLAANMATWLLTPSSANLAATLTDETGSGAVVFANTPTLIAPLLGTPTSGNLSNCTALPVGSITGLGTNVGTWLATPSSANLAAALTDETGSGAAVFANTPTLVTPVLGVATATSINGTTIPSSKTLVVTTDKISVLAATSSAELAGVISDETGSGALVFANTPTFVTPLLGTPTSGTLTNCTGYVEANLVFTDVTTNNASTSNHGLLKKLDNSAVHYMDGQGNWSTPSGSGAVNAFNQKIMTLVTSTQAFTPNASTKYIEYRAVGGGGGGGGVTAGGAGTAAAAESGASAGYTEGICTVATWIGAGTAATITIGAAGAGGAAGSNNGSAGGNTTIVANSGAGATLATANGGGGGNTNASSGAATAAGGNGAGGTASGGTLNITGSNSGSGFTFAAGAASWSSEGGSTNMGRGGPINTGGPGSAGTGYGSGGGGGVCQASTNRAGGAGTVGAVLVIEYLSA